MRTQTNSNVVTLTAWICFVAGLGWTVLLLYAVIGTELTRTFPLRFFDWVVEIQNRGTSRWPLPSHSEAYYLTKFFVLTFLLECLGIWGFLRLRSRSKSRSSART